MVEHSAGQKSYGAQREKRKYRIDRDEIKEAAGPAVRDVSAEDIAGGAPDIPRTHQQSEARGGGADRRRPDRQFHDRQKRQIIQNPAQQVNHESGVIRPVEQMDRGADCAARDRDAQQAARLKAPAQAQIITGASKLPTPLAALRYPMSATGNFSVVV